MAAPPLENYALTSPLVGDGAAPFQFLGYPPPGGMPAPTDFAQPLALGPGYDVSIGAPQGWAVPFSSIQLLPWQSNGADSPQFNAGKAQPDFVLDSNGVINSLNPTDHTLTPINPADSLAYAKLFDPTQPLRIAVENNGALVPAQQATLEGLTQLRQIAWVQEMQALATPQLSPDSPLTQSMTPDTAGTVDDAFQSQFSPPTGRQEAVDPASAIKEMLALLHSGAGGSYDTVNLRADGSSEIGRYGLCGDDIGEYFAEAIEPSDTDDQDAKNAVAAFKNNKPHHLEALIGLIKAHPHLLKKTMARLVDHGKLPGKLAEKFDSKDFLDHFGELLERLGSKGKISKQDLQSVFPKELQEAMTETLIAKFLNSKDSLGARSNVSPAEIALAMQLGKSPSDLSDADRADGAKYLTAAEKLYNLAAARLSTDSGSSDSLDPNDELAVRAAKVAMWVGDHVNTVGRCAHWFNDAFYLAFGVSLPRQPSATDYSGVLSQVSFLEKLPDNAPRRAGDIEVLLSSPQHPDGHVRIIGTNGQDCSDHVQEWFGPRNYGGLVRFRVKPGWHLPS